MRVLVAYWQCEAVAAMTRVLVASRDTCTRAVPMCVCASVLTRGVIPLCESLNHR